MKIYFEDGCLMHTSLVPVEIDFTVDARNGVTQNIESLDLFMRQRPDATIYTNYIFAFNNMYSWNEELKAPEVYIRTNGIEFTRIDKLTHRELRQGHNLAKMYVAGEFDSTK